MQAPIGLAQHLPRILGQSMKVPIETVDAQKPAVPDEPSDSAAFKLTPVTCQLLLLPPDRTQLRRHYLVPICHRALIGNPSISRPLPTLLPAGCPVSLLFPFADYYKGDYLNSFEQILDKIFAVSTS